MKKTIPIFLLCIMLVSLLTISTFAADGQAIYATAEPVIDGEIDEIWEYAPAMQGSMAGDNYVEGTTATGYTKLLWTEENLYILCDIVDPTIPTNARHWNNSVDLWVSEKNTKADNYASNPGDWLLTVSSNGSISETDTYAILSTHTRAVKLTDKGYIIEAKVPYDSDIAAKIGTVIGFNTSYNDDYDSDEVRDAWCSWQPYDGRPYWSNTLSLNEVEFIDGPVLETVEETETPGVETPGVAAPAAEVEITPVVEAPAVQAPATADNGIIQFIAIAVIMLTCIVIIAKKSKVI
jgi:hypothetical protein